MKLRFDFYTDDVALATAAYTIAFEGGADDLDMRRVDWDCRIRHNVMGTIDHRRMEALFDYFEANGFTDD